MASFGYLLPTRGVVFSSRSDTELTARAHADVVDLAQRAEATGFDGVWVGDSVLAKPRFEPMTALAAVATVTDAVDLGTAVYLPALRHPVNVAHQAATVDRIAGGRLKLGVGVGARPIERAEAENLDVPFDRRGSLLNEVLDIVDRLWAGGPVDHDGEFFDLDDADLGFGPSGEVSIYVASARFDPSEGFPRTVRRRIAAHGGGWLPISLEPETYAAGLKHIHDALRDVDRDPDAFAPAYYMDVVVADTERAAIEAAREFYVAYYLGGDADESAAEAFPDEEIRANGAFGPPEDVAERIARYEDAGVEEFVVRFVGSDQREQLRRFRDVLRS